MEIKHLELQRELSKNVNTQQCKHCPDFTLINGEPVCKFEPTHPDAKCILLDEELNKNP